MPGIDGTTPAGGRVPRRHIPASIKFAAVRAAFFQLDAFTSERFRGNPAGVVVLERFPADSVLQAIAAENNLPETAFLVQDGLDHRLRWFTPTTEVPLCGHATLEPALTRLDARERLVLHLRVEEDLVQTEIGSLIGVSQMQVADPASRAEEAASVRE